MKLRWKNRKQKKNDRELMMTVVKSIGLKPTTTVYNHEHQYFEVTWKRDNTDNFFQVKVGESLFVTDEEDGKLRLSVWVRFVHPEASPKAIQFTVYDSEDVSQLLLESRAAILMLRAEKVVP